MAKLIDYEVGTPKSRLCTSDNNEVAFNRLRQQYYGLRKKNRKNRKMPKLKTSHQIISHISSRPLNASRIENKIVTVRLQKNY